MERRKELEGGVLRYETVTLLDFSEKYSNISRVLDQDKLHPRWYRLLLTEWHVKLKACCLYTSFFLCKTIYLLKPRVSSERKLSRKKCQNFRSYFANFFVKFRIFLRKNAQKIKTKFRENFRIFRERMKFEIFGEIYPFSLETLLRPIFGCFSL